MASRLALRTLMQSTSRQTQLRGSRLIQSKYNIVMRACQNIGCCRNCSTAAPTEGAAQPADYEKVTGIEKRELDQRLAGNADPFKMNVRTGPKGTKTNPIMVPSMMPERIVGCTCDPDSPQINWIIVKQGEMKRCICGNCFMLYEAPPTDVWA